MVTSIWGRIKQAYGDSNRATGEGAGVYTATHVLSNARMKTLRATPLEVVRGIPNRIVVPVLVTLFIPQVTTARTGSVDIRLQWKRGSSWYSATNDIDRSSMHGATANARFAVTIPNSSGHSDTMEGLSLYLRNPDSSESGAGSSDNIVTFDISYYIVKG